MKTQNTFSISFFLKKDKAKSGNAPLFARITVNGDFRDLSTKRWVKISDWNQKRQKLLLAVFFVENKQTTELELGLNRSVHQTDPLVNTFLLGIILFQ